MESREPESMDGGFYECYGLECRYGYEKCHDHPEYLDYFYFIYFTCIRFKKYGQMQY